MASTAPAARADRLTAVIVGAGMSGLLAAVRLKKAGIDSFVIVEKSDSVGGTWHHNRYPGAACDVPSHLYSYSFAPNSEWTRAFARQPEILAYFRGVAERFGLTPHIRFNTEVAGASFDEAAGEWTVRAADGREWRSRILIVGTGQLNRPWTPAIPGRDSFTGAQMHSAEWDAELPLSGKRVGVIGNGASAVQLVPEVAVEAARLTIFQRSPNWIVPRPDEPITAEQHERFRRVPLRRLFTRFLIWGGGEWRWNAFKNVSSLAARQLEKAARAQLDEQVPDPALRAKLTPDYPIGCKRILITGDYYPALSRDNVALETRAIAAIRPEGVEVDGGEVVPLDVLVWATGFDTAGFLVPMEIVGRAGRRLHDAWASHAEAHRGVTVAGFPNMFILYGPNTNLGHNSIIYMSERQMDYAMQLIEALLRRDALAIEVQPHAQERYNAELQRDLSRTVWAGNCSSWYKHEGRITNNWSSSTIRYWWQTRRADLDAYSITPRPRPEPATA